MNIAVTRRIAVVGDWLSKGTAGTRNALLQVVENMIYESARLS